ERTVERSDDLRGFELGGNTRPIWLRGNHEVKVCASSTVARNDAVEQETKIIAIDDEYYRAFINGIARFGAVARLPMAAEKWFERVYLITELVRGGAAEGDLMPNQ